MRRVGVLAPALFFCEAAFALADSNSIAFVVALLAGAACISLSFSPRIACISVAATLILAATLGPIALVPIAALILTPHIGQLGALTASIALLLSGLCGATFSTFLVNVAAPVVSIIVVVIPAFTWVLIRVRQLQFHFLLGSLIYLLAMILTISWGLEIELIEMAVFTSPPVRPFLVAILALYAAVGGKDEPRALSTRTPSALALVGTGVTVFAITLAVGLNRTPITEVVFDESHGQWEPVSSSFLPDDFGRGSVYTYSVLAEYLRRAGYVVRVHSGPEFPTLTSTSLLVLKMPTSRMAATFVEQLNAWIQNGGRAMFIADHTDLFNTTQNLNAWLSKVGISIAPTAVFDRQGLPIDTADWAPGGIFTPRGLTSHKFLTGASFSDLPPYAAVLRAYGASFAEPAIYFRANRFGYFSPSADLPFANHAAVAAVPVGRGLLLGWLDSTHWTNFVMYVDGYQDAILRSIGQLEQVERVQLLAMGVCVAWIALALGTFWSGAWIAWLLAVIVGALSALQIAGSSPSTPTVRPDISVVLGERANWEILTPLVQQPDRNFARALTALQKYGVIVRTGGAPDGRIDVSQVKLWINPNFGSLPNSAAVLSALRAGKRLAFLFPQSEGGERQVREWLRSLALGVRVERALVITGDIGVPIQDRRSNTFGRVAVTRAQALSDSLFIEVESNNLYQRFRLRVLESDRSEITGELVVSFSSEQFSDAAIGEVWDGTPTSDLSRLRERELAAFLGLTSPGHIGAIWSTGPSLTEAIVLPYFVVLRDGRLLVDGRLSDTRPPQTHLALTEDPNAFLHRLQLESLTFVKTHCTAVPSGKFCDRTLVTPDLIEWFVIPSWDVGRVVGIELIHDGRLSDSGGPLNVVFSRQ